MARWEPVELEGPPVLDLLVGRERVALAERAGRLLRAEPEQAEWPAQEDSPEPGRQGESEQVEQPE